MIQLGIIRGDDTVLFRNDARINESLLDRCACEPRMESASRRSYMVYVRFPDTGWHMGNLHSPRIERILDDFLPRRALKNGQVICKLPKPMIDIFKKAVRMRNEVTHKGHYESLDAARLQKFMRCAKELLITLDNFSGHHWAVDRISNPMRAYLVSSGQSELPAEWPNVPMFW